MKELRKEMQRALDEERAKQMEEGEWTEYDRGLADGWVEALEYVMTWTSTSVLGQRETRVVNVVQVDDRVCVTVRYPDDAIYEGSMQDVMLNE